jgi:hypothetical protein
VSRVGDPYDTANVESFMKTLKKKSTEANRNLRQAPTRHRSFIETCVTVSVV